MVSRARQAWPPSSQGACRGARAAYGKAVFVSAGPFVFHHSQVDSCRVRCVYATIDLDLVSGACAVSLKGLLLR